MLSVGNQQAKLTESSVIWRLAGVRRKKVQTQQKIRLTKLEASSQTPLIHHSFPGKEDKPAGKGLIKTVFPTQSYCF